MTVKNMNVKGLQYMDVNVLFKIAGIGLLVAVAYQILSRSGREEQDMLVSLAGVILALIMLTDEINTLFTSIRSIFGI